MIWMIAIGKNLQKVVLRKRKSLLRLKFSDVVREYRGRDFSLFFYFVFFIFSLFLSFSIQVLIDTSCRYRVSKNFIDFDRYKFCRVSLQRFSA